MDDYITKWEGDEGYLPVNPPDSDKPPCLVEHEDGPKCTRVEGHKGKHAAHGQINGRIVQLVSWE